MVWFGSGGNSVLVYTDKDQYRPGEQINGHALVNIVTETAFSGLFVKLTAKERVRFQEQEAYQVPVTEFHTVDGRTETRHTTRTEHRTVTRYGKHVIFRTEIMLLSGGDLMRGQFTVPFSFLLPNGLPGSFALHGYDFDCGIDYKVKALVKVPGLLKANLRSVGVFEVQQPSPPFTQSIMGTNSAKVTTCCCFSKGYAQLEFKCTRDSFCSGECVTLVASANNNSSSELKRVTVKLRRRIQLHTNFGHSKFWDLTISEAIYPGVPPRGSVKDVQMTLQIPADAPQQCFGTLIQCMYSVRLSGKVKCGSDATCTVPAFIYRPLRTSSFVPPDDNAWNPISLPNVPIALPSAPVIPQQMSLAHYPDVVNLQPSAPVEVSFNRPTQQILLETNAYVTQPRVSPSAQPGLDAGFIR